MDSPLTIGWPSRNVFMDLVGLWLDQPRVSGKTAGIKRLTDGIQVLMMMINAITRYGEMP